MSRTAGPWKFSNRAEHGCCFRSSVRDAQDNLIADADEEDAHFIVTACNAHEELVAALELVRDWNGGTNDKTIQRAVNEALAKLRPVVA